MDRVRRRDDVRGRVLPDHLGDFAYFANSNKIDNPRRAWSSHLWAWGLWDLIIAVVAIFAGLSLLGGGSGA